VETLSEKQQNRARVLISSLAIENIALSQEQASKAVLKAEEADISSYVAKFAAEAEPRAQVHALKA
jgi:hypothetical protein